MQRFRPLVAGRAPARRAFVTAFDVARAAGVSRSAVSRTFTPGASVSTDMRDKVIEAAGRLGYRVNRLAQSLISARSNLVGLVGTTIEMPFHASLISSLSQALLAEGYQCMLLNAANAARDMSALIERILEYRVAAVVVTSGTPSSSIVEECLRNGVRVILINKPMPDLDIDTVVADDAAAGREAAERLVAAGCRRLAVVSSADRTASLIGRLTAFRARAHELGASVREWESGATTYDNGADAARALARDVDGAFCVTDVLALGFLDAARHECGRAVPRDLCVIGFDDIPQAAWSAYRLATFHQSPARISDAVMQILRRRAAQADAPCSFVRLRAAFVARDSIRPGGAVRP
jgi:DNA-binding LacI/PurR family transcriptional regulator